MAGLLIDLDGVLYEGDGAIPGAAEAIAWLRAEGIAHLFLTNTTSRPRRALAGKLAALGIPTDEQRILTPPVAARRWLAAHAEGPVALFVPEETRGEFEGLALLDDDAESGAAALVVGDLGAGWTFDVLNRAFRLLMAPPRPPIVALGMTRYWRTGGRLQLDVAPFVVGLQHASGCRVEVLGKPAAPFFAVALDMLGTAPGAAVMIGDDVHGDVGAAQAADIRGVLVRTGKFTPDDLGQDVVPDAVLGSIADLPDWWRAGGLGAGCS